MMEATNIPIEKDMIKVMANVIPTAVGVSILTRGKAGR